MNGSGRYSFPTLNRVICDMLICVNVVQVCDARDDDSSTAVDYIILLTKLYLIQLWPILTRYVNFFSSSIISNTVQYIYKWIGVLYPGD